MLIPNDTFTVKGSFSNWIYHPSNIQNDDSLPYVSYDKPFSFVEIKINEKQKLKLSGYCLNLFSVKVKNAHMLKWAIIGSNDKLKWYVIDEKDLNNVEKIEYNKLTFHCSTTDSFRYFRLIQTSKNSEGNNILFLAYLELYGILQS